MIPLDYEDFFTRAKDVKNYNKDLYLEKIASFSASDKDKTLFNEVFSNHVNTFDPSINELLYSEDTPDRHIKSDHLSAYFVNKIYEIPNISDFDSGKNISFDKFIGDFLITSFSNQNDEDSL